MTASNYYMLAIAAAIACFFIVWEFLQGGTSEMPWATAGIAASVVLGGAVVLREFILRRVHRRHLHRGRGPLDATARTGDGRNPNKLTIEKNALVLNEIRKKSEAATILGRLAAGHREVFELCSEYLARNETELSTVAAGSPRLAPLLRGRTDANDMHRFHMLHWAQIEANSFADAAGNKASIEDRIENARRAVGIVDYALGFYPDESALSESRLLLAEMLVSITVSHRVSEAEGEVFAGRYEDGIAKYEEALSVLDHYGLESLSSRRAAVSLEDAIKRLRNRRPEHAQEPDARDLADRSTGGR